MQGYLWNGRKNAVIAAHYLKWKQKPKHYVAWPQFCFSGLKGIHPSLGLLFYCCGCWVVTSHTNKSIICHSCFIWHSYCALLESKMQSCPIIKNNPSFWLSLSHRKTFISSVSFAFIFIFCFSLSFWFSFLMLIQILSQANKNISRLSLFFVFLFCFFVLFPFTHRHHHHTVILRDSDVTRAMSYNKGVANILPSPTHPPLEKNNTVQDLLTPNFLPSNQAILESGRTSRAAHEEPSWWEEKGECRPLHLL